mgnify:CR=1 FL=1
MNAGAELFDILKKYPLAIVCFFIFLGCLAFIFVRGDQLTELTTEEASLKDRLEVIERNARYATDLEGQLEQIRSAVEEIDTRLFKVGERAVNTNFFYGMEAMFGIRLTSINQRPGSYIFYNKGEIKELKHYSTMVYNLSLTGQLTDLLSFIYQLRQVEPFMRVADLQMSTANRETGSLECSLTVVVMSERE